MLSLSTVVIAVVFRPSVDIDADFTSRRSGYLAEVEVLLFRDVLRLFLHEDEYSYSVALRTSGDRLSF